MAKVRTRKRGKTYSYIFEAGKKPNGTRKVVEKGGFPTQDDAYNAGVEAYTDWKHGNIGITSEHISLQQFIENWLHNVCALNVRASSLTTYRSNARNHIYPFLGSLCVQELTPAILDQWIRAQAKKGYAYRSLALMYRIVKQSLDYAVYPAELISTNPALYIKIPKSAPRQVVKRTIISPQAFSSLLKKVATDKSLTIILQILYHTGMRISELCGLEWNCVDFQAKTIEIKQQLIRYSRKLHIQPVKTHSSVRTIYIDDNLVALLRSWRSQQAANELRLGEAYIFACKQSDNTISCMSKLFAEKTSLPRVSFICTQKSGRPFVASDVNRKLHAYGYNTHSFRHTHATLLAENGASAKGISARLGHSQTNITENLYMHATDKIAHQTADVFSSIMQAKNADK